MRRGSGSSLKKVLRITAGRWTSSYCWKSTGTPKKVHRAKTQCSLAKAGPPPDKEWDVVVRAQKKGSSILKKNTERVLKHFIF